MVPATENKARKMNVAFQDHWLEKIVENDRDARSIARKIGESAEFIDLVANAISDAEEETKGKTDMTRRRRLIAQSIARRLSQSFGGFKSV
jgi:hypothetical protein